MKWQLSYVENWRIPDDHPNSELLGSPALQRGTLFHSVMENHYRFVQAVQRGEDATGFKQNVLALLAADPLTGDQTESQELIEWMYRGYIEKYGYDEDWEIVEVEKPFELWLPTETGHRSSVKMKGTVDLLVRVKSMGRGLWLVDHKTCKDLPKDKEIDLDDQAAIYTYLLRRHGLDVRGHIRNAVRTQRLKTRDMQPEERFLRRITVRDETELETMALEALRLMREAYGSLKEGVTLPRSPNIDTCRWRCNLTEPCIAGRTLGPKRMREFLADIGMSQHENKPGPTFAKDKGP